VLSADAGLLVMINNNKFTLPIGGTGLRGTQQEAADVRTVVDGGVSRGSGTGGIIAGG